LFIPISAYAISDQNDQPELYFRGNNGSMNSACDNLAYHIDAAINSDEPTPIKIEIIDPDGKVVGVYEDTTRGSLSLEIDVDYTRSGQYLIHFYYKGEIYEEDYGWEVYHIPSHEAQIQCLVTHAINEGVYHEYFSLTITSNHWGVTWRDTKDTLQNILEDELFAYYEPMLCTDSEVCNLPYPSKRMATDLAFIELDNLHNILNDYAHEKTSLNYEIAENQIKKMDISDEDKVNVIYERRLNYEKTVEIFENNNGRFIEQIKGVYLSADARDEAEKLREIQELEIEDEKRKIQEEITQEKEKILEEIKDFPKVMPEPEPVPEQEGLSYSDDIEPLLDKGHALANEKKYAEALEQFDKVLEMTDHEIVQGKVFLAKGNIYFNMDEYEIAIQYYDKVLEIEPRHAQTLLYKGILYQETKEWQKSIDMFEQVLDYSGEDVPGYMAYSQERLDANKKFEERGGCLIATATFGSELAPQVQQLREIRENILLQTASGTSFMTGFNEFYYSFSPAIADLERQNPVFKEAVKLAITPLITSLSILNYVEIDSEAEMLSYGISLILLNIGMYFVAPAIVIVKLRRQVLH